jgi:hypothetical protein
MFHDVRGEAKGVPMRRTVEQCNRRRSVAYWALREGTVNVGLRRVGSPDE